jgi:hypothetical protein
VVVVLGVVVATFELVELVVGVVVTIASVVGRAGAAAVVGAEVVEPGTLAAGVVTATLVVASPNGRVVGEVVVVIFVEVTGTTDVVVDEEVLVVDCGATVVELLPGVVVDRTTTGEGCVDAAGALSMGTTSELTPGVAGRGLFALALFPRVGASAPTTTGSPEPPDDPPTDTSSFTNPAGIPPSVFASGSMPST